MSGPSMKGIAPWHQTNWDWRAAGNFIGGGTGTGLLVFAALAGGEQYRWLALLGLAFVGAGLSCVWAEIGRPWRALNVFRHSQTSWMTREALIAPVLFLAGLVAVAANGGVTAWLTAAIALGFLYCQGRILFASKGIPAWRQPRIVPLLILTGITEGAGWTVLLAAFLGIDATGWLGATLLVLAVARYWNWACYLRQLREKGAPEKTLAVLAKLDRPYVLAGNALPAALAFVSVVAGWAWLLALAGVLSALGGWWLKLTIVARAAFNQGFALPKLPVRGVGVPAPGVKPGWTAPQVMVPPSTPQAQAKPSLRDA